MARLKPEEVSLALRQELERYQSQVRLDSVGRVIQVGDGIARIHPDGSGLGLYVAKEIIKAHKGKIWAESEGEGKGSKFFVELPGK